MKKQMLEEIYSQSYTIKGGDFINAGTISVQIKRLLKELGLNQELIYKASICCYEAEMNAVMYATVTMLDFIITPKEVLLKLDDKGPGIENIALALKEGYSTATEEMREMGFGAGMGLPNIKKNADEFVIKSKVNEGTSQLIKFNLNSQA